MLFKFYEQSWQVMRIAKHLRWFEMHPKAKKSIRIPLTVIKQNRIVKEAQRIAITSLSAINESHANHIKRQTKVIGCQGKACDNPLNICRMSWIRIERSAQQMELSCRCYRKSSKRTAKSLTIHRKGSESRRTNTHGSSKVNTYIYTYTYKYW